MTTNLKSTQTNPYTLSCFIQEAATYSEVEPGQAKIKRAINGNPYCVFPALLQTYSVYNRMNRMYSIKNVQDKVDNDERIITLESQNKWRGELNHPNADVKGQVLSDIRMTIPEPTKSSHFINHHKFENNRFTAEITTHPNSEPGIQVTSETVDLHITPSFSVRVCGTMIPNAPYGTPNINVTRVITVDWVDFPSHINADGDIRNIVESYAVENYANAVYLKELAKYCVDQNEKLKIVCESFQISAEELMGVTTDGSLMIHQQDSSKIRIPLPSEIRRDAINNLMGRR